MSVGSLLSPASPMDWLRAIVLAVALLVIHSVASLVHRWLSGRVEASLQPALSAAEPRLSATPVAPAPAAASVPPVTVTSAESQTSLAPHATLIHVDTRPVRTPMPHDAAADAAAVATDAVKPRHHQPMSTSDPTGSPTRARRTPGAVSPSPPADIVVDHVPTTGNPTSPAAQHSSAALPPRATDLWNAPHSFRGGEGHTLTANHVPAAFARSALRTTVDGSNRLHLHMPRSSSHGRRNSRDKNSEPAATATAAATTTAAAAAAAAASVATTTHGAGLSSESSSSSPIAVPGALSRATGGSGVDHSPDSVRSVRMLNSLAEDFDFEQPVTGVGASVGAASVAAASTGARASTDDAGADVGAGTGAGADAGTGADAGASADAGAATTTTHPSGVDAPVLVASVAAAVAIAAVVPALSPSVGPPATPGPRFGIAGIDVHSPATLRRLAAATGGVAASSSSSTVSSVASPAASPSPPTSSSATAAVAAPQALRQEPFSLVSFPETAAAATAPGALHHKRAAADSFRLSSELTSVALQRAHAESANERLSRDHHLSIPRHSGDSDDDDDDDRAFDLPTPEEIESLASDPAMSYRAFPLELPLVTLAWKVQPRTVLLVRRWRDQALLEPCQEIATILTNKGVIVYTEQSTIEELRVSENIRSVESLMLLNGSVPIDLVVCLGGDGTFLFAVSLFPRVVPPVLSFNCGSLGFLVPFLHVELESALQSVFDGSANVLLRARLRCSVIRAEHDGDSATRLPPVENVVLNEVVIDRGENVSIGLLDCYLNGNLITSIQADGVIVATATGSTAYSLSAGGSLIHPDIPCMIMTPICPHSLSARPVVIPESSDLVIVVPMDARGDHKVSFDGRDKTLLRRGDALRVVMSPHPVVQYTTKDPSSWFTRLAEHLRWNVRLRQKQLNAGGAAEKEE